MTGSNWDRILQSTPEMKIQAAKEFAKSKPAIIQQVALPALEFKVTCRKLWKSVEELLPLLEEFVNGRWKEFGATKDIASVEVFGRSWRSVNKKFSDLTHSLISEEVAYKPTADKSDTLNKLSELPAPESVTTSETTPEKPQVQAATPEQMKPQPHTPADQPKDEPVVWKDRVGNVIPPAVLPFWHRSQEVQDQLTAISRVKCFIEKAQQDNDPFWVSWDTSTVIQDLGAIHHRLSCFVPYGVCRACFGNINGELCKLCHGTGFNDKHTYERNKG